MQLYDIVAFCQKMAVLAEGVGWLIVWGEKLRSYLGLRILLAKWVGGARVKA